MTTTSVFGAQLNQEDVRPQLTPHVKLWELCVRGCFRTRRWRSAHRRSWRLAPHLALSIIGAPPTAPAVAVLPDSALRAELMEICSVESHRSVRAPAASVAPTARRGRVLALLALGLALLPLPAHSGEKPAEAWPIAVQARYSLRYNGIEVGRLEINSNTDREDLFALGLRQGFGVVRRVQMVGLVQRFRRRGGRRSRSRDLRLRLAPEQEGRHRPHRLQRPCCDARSPSSRRRARSAIWCP